MKGTIKQIEWTEDIKKNMLKKFSDNKNIIDFINKQDSAVWFIENRYKSDYEIDAIAISEKEVQELAETVKTDERIISRINKEKEIGKRSITITMIAQLISRDILIADKVYNELTK